MIIDNKSEKSGFMPRMRELGYETEGQIADHLSKVLGAPVSTSMRFSSNTLSMHMDFNIRAEIAPQSGREAEQKINEKIGNVADTGLSVLAMVHETPPHFYIGFNHWDGKCAERLVGAFGKIADISELVRQAETDSTAEFKKLNSFPSRASRTIENAVHRVRAFF